MKLCLSHGFIFGISMFNNVVKRPILSIMHNFNMAPISAYYHHTIFSGGLNSTEGKEQFI